MRRRGVAQYVNLDPELFRCFDLSGARVYADHLAAQIRDLPGQHPVSASEVENALTRLWGKQIQNRPTQIGNKSCVLRVCCRIPGLIGSHKENCLAAGRPKSSATAPITHLLQHPKGAK